MSKEEELNYLRNMVKILSNRLVYSTKPYDLTINEIQKDLVANNKIDERKFMLNIIDKCTNVVFDKDIFEVADPTYEVAMIIGEVTLMFLEIVEEQKLYADIQLKINGNKKEVIKKEEEPKEEKIEKKEIKEEEPKIIKPKKRPRGKR